MGFDLVVTILMNQKQLISQVTEQLARKYMHAYDVLDQCNIHIYLPSICIFVLLTFRTLVAG